MIDKNERMFSNKYLLILIVPLLIEVFLSVAVGMADTMMVAQDSEASVAGVSSINTIQNLFVFLFQAFATGGAIIASQYIGKGDKERACFSSKQLMNISFIASIAISIAMLVFRAWIINLVYGDLEDDVYECALSYFVPILLSMPFFAMQSSANAICRTMGKSMITMVVSLIVNIVNIAGNAIFLFSFNMGAMGVGLASLISRIIGATIMCIVICNKSHEIHIEEPFKIQFDFHLIGKILKIAIPSALENTIFNIGKILVSAMIVSLGTSAIAANAVLDNIGTFSNMPGSAISMAMITVIGQCCGAKKFDQARHYGKKLMAIAYISMSSLSLALIIALPYLTEIYNLPPATTELAIKVLRLNLIQSAIFWPLSFTFPNFLRATGDVKYTMIVAIASMWIFRVVFSRIFAINLGMGLEGIYWGMYLDWYCRIVFFIIRYLSGKWEKKTIV